VKRWWVVSPEYMTYGGWADPPEAPEYGCDAIEVAAETKRDALILGVRELLKDQDSYPGTNRQDGRPPWADMRVEPSPPCECCGEYEACSCKRGGEDPPYTCISHGGSFL
jgi:hypothetical protein